MQYITYKYDFILFLSSSFRKFRRNVCEYEASIGICNDTVTVLFSKSRNILQFYKVLEYMARLTAAYHVLSQRNLAFHESVYVQQANFEKLISPTLRHTFSMAQS